MRLLALAHTGLKTYIYYTGCGHTRTQILAAHNRGGVPCPEPLSEEQAADEDGECRRFVGARQPQGCQ